MGQYRDSLSDKQQQTILRQKVFFVGTAGASGTINVSPRGLDCLRILDAKRLAWVDYPGSGNETALHLGELDRITVLFCDLEGTDPIVRVFGRGRPVLPDAPEFAGLLDEMGMDPEDIIRQVFLVDVELTQSSCGTGVPVYDFAEEGPLVTKWRKVAAAGKLASAQERLAAMPRPIEALEGE